MNTVQKCLCLFIGVFGFCLSAQACDYTTMLDAKEHLLEVNKEWRYYPNAVPAKQIHFQHDNQRIRLHLELVIQHLNENIPTEINSKALAQRKILLQELEQYAAREVFPINLYHAHRQPYFIDHKGTHCAVGYLMKVSGAGALAQRISAVENHAYLAEIKTEGVAEWAEKYGSTLEELAWIQPGYPATRTVEHVGGGANGPINSLSQHPYQDKFLIAGNFGLLDNSPCLNVGEYANDQLDCIGGGVAGTVNDVVYIGNAIVAIGDLIGANNVHYPVATYSNGAWTFSSIPGQSNAIGKILTTQYIFTGSLSYLAKILVVEKSTGDEVWQEDHTGNWTRIISTTGRINAIAETGSGRLYAGDFDAITKHFSSGPDQNITTYNYFIDDIYGAGFGTYTNSPSTLLPDTIQTVAVSSYGVVYFGGTCSQLGEACVTRLLNNSLQPTMVNSGFSNDRQVINDIAVNSYTGDLILVGDFHSTNAGFIGNYGNNIVQYDPGLNMMVPYNTFNKAINGVVIAADGDVFFGGEANIAGSSFAFNHLATFTVVNSVAEINDAANALEAQFYPNPTSDLLNIEVETDKEIHLQLIDNLGRIVLTKQTNDTKIQLDMSQFTAGVYHIAISDGEKMTNTPIVKD